MTSATLAAQEPPEAWFLNAHGTGGDYVYFSVGGGGGVPPQDSRDVLLGWSWDDAGTAVERYPGSVAARYRASRFSGKQPRQWYADGRRAGVPRLGIGPGRELLLLGDDERSTTQAMRWAEMLDSVEAAYRHSSPDLSPGERHGIIEVGRVGRCAIRSVPVDGTQQGWSTLPLPGHARPSRSGGFYYVDPFDDARVPGRTVEVQRFLRLLDGPDDCGGLGLDLSLMPAPREEAFNPPYFLVWSDLELQPLGFLDLEPTPRTPTVRTLARYPGTAREEINIATWPAPGTQGNDLCRAPFMETLCLKDLRVREQLATAAVADPEVADALTAGCRDFFDRLGDVPSPHPCSDPSVWRQSIGTYRTGYTGEMVLQEEPRLVSRMTPAGEVQWLWSGRQAPRQAARFPLADGTRIELGMPRTAPPRISDRPTTPLSTPPSTTLSQGQPPAQAPPSSDPRDETFDPTPPPPSSVTDPVPPSTVASTDPLPGNAADPGTTSPPTTTDPQSRPSEIDPGTQPPDSTTGPGSTGPGSTDPGTTTPETTIDPTTPALQPPSATSAEPSGIGAAMPAAGLTPNWLWLIALVILAMTVSVALLLRSHKASARARRVALASGLVAEEPAHELLLDEDTHGDRLLTGRTSADPPTPEPILIEPTPETALDSAVEDPIDEAPSTDPSELEDEVAEDVVAEDEVAPTVMPLEPPRLSATHQTTVGTASHQSQLAREMSELAPPERQGIHQSLAAISRLGEWVSCLLPVLTEIEHGSGSLLDLDRLPPPAQQEWRECYQALREFTDLDLAALHCLQQELAHTASGEAGTEAQYFSAAGLLDPKRGSLPERLRQHLLRPGSGRLQDLVLSLQYLIEAFPVEHMEKSERKAYLSTVRRRLQDKGLSTKFHLLVGELAAGLGLHYQEIRLYKARVDDPGNAFLEHRHTMVDLSQRLGYPAGTDGKVVVRHSELFLFEPESGVPYSGQAAIDQGS